MVAEIVLKTQSRRKVRTRFLYTLKVYIVKIVAGNSRPWWVHQRGASSDARIRKERAPLGENPAERQG